MANKKAADIVLEDLLFRLEKYHGLRGDTWIKEPNYQGTPEEIEYLASLGMVQRVNIQTRSISTLLRGDIGTVIQDDFETTMFTARGKETLNKLRRYSQLSGFIKPIYLHFV